MENYYWFSMFVACNAIILLVLATNVSLLRIKHKISIGDGGNKQLLNAIRVHANGIEQVPIFSLLLLGLIYSHIGQLAVVMLAVTFTLSRILHACGMLFRIHLARRVSASMTYALQAIAAVMLLVQLNA